jgi:hypothetical protein
MNLRPIPSRVAIEIALLDENLTEQQLRQEIKRILKQHLNASSIERKRTEEYEKAFSFVQQYDERIDGLLQEVLAEN